MKFLDLTTLGLSYLFLNDPMFQGKNNVADSKNIFKKKPTWSDVLFVILIVLLLIPQTRKPLMVVVGKVKVWAFSPSLETQKNQIQLTAFDYHVKDLSGKATTVSVGKNQVVFLSYWATWCPPCIAEMPSIQQLYNAYGKQISVMLLTREDPKIVNDFLKKEHLELPVYTPNMKTPPGLNDKRLPTSYLIDGDGIILIKETGASDWNSKKVRQLLNQLLEAEIAEEL